MRVALPDECERLLLVLLVHELRQQAALLLEALPGAPALLPQLALPQAAPGVARQQGRGRSAGGGRRRADGDGGSFGRVALWREDPDGGHHVPPVRVRLLLSIGRGVLLVVVSLLQDEPGRVHLLVRGLDIPGDIKWG